jgi:hypothetical protein
MSGRSTTGTRVGACSRPGREGHGIDGKGMRAQAQNPPTVGHQHEERGGSCHVVDVAVAVDFGVVDR